METLAYMKKWEVEIKYFAKLFLIEKLQQKIVKTDTNKLSE